jgi:hypothetical protein
MPEETYRQLVDTLNGSYFNGKLFEILGSTDSEAELISMGELGRLPGNISDFIEDFLKNEIYLEGDTFDEQFEEIQAAIIEDINELMEPFELVNMIPNYHDMTQADLEILRMAALVPPFNMN